MAVLDILPVPTLLSRIASALAPAEPASCPDLEIDNTRRNFVLEMLKECPEAFASEEGIRGAMYYFSGRF